MAGLDPAIHVFATNKTWMPGIKPGMTIESSLLDFRRSRGSVSAMIALADYRRP
jgi:hypothetical protein